MKQDWDIIREILLKLENSQPREKKSLSLSDFPEKDWGKVSFHVELLLEAGFIKGQMLGELGVEVDNFLVTRITWTGYEFLNSIRDDSIWSKVKNRFAENSVSMTTDLIKSVAGKILESIMT